MILNQSCTFPPNTKASLVWTNVCLQLILMNIKTVSSPLLPGCSSVCEQLLILYQAEYIRESYITFIFLFLYILLYFIYIIHILFLHTVYIYILHPPLELGCYGAWILILCWIFWLAIRSLHLYSYIFILWLFTITAKPHFEQLRVERLKE